MFMGHLTQSRELLHLYLYIQPHDQYSLHQDGQLRRKLSKQSNDLMYTNRKVVNGK